MGPMVIVVYPSRKLGIGYSEFRFRISDNGFRIFSDFTPQFRVSGFPRVVSGPEPGPEAPNLPRCAAFGTRRRFN
jgi:hypothetical protein